ncbi:amidase family protein [Sneathiella chinensis]|uniref:Amidase n=1 Tax=Sneathiella chinensis TaxID=349750 RepID=A0ABQ5TZL4_9PROT|nr:amidase family protein [Sneathiella chinensis]GLQ05054.1 amidase [Sneathiella chinensis]
MMDDAVTFPWDSATVSDRLDQVLDRLVNRGEAPSAFTAVLEKRSRDMAAAIKAGDARPLAGALVSIKALLDVRDEVTHAGTDVLAGNAPATADAPCLQRLEDAGAVFVGITNMSEFAYSGVGLNPHYGTPDNPVFPGCIPGGSSSGAAVSVALGLCDIAIGSDTGGSLRIPAAFCGIVGFKPTQATVSLAGGKALSDSLDSFGPMATSVAACERAWQVLAGRETTPVAAGRRRLVVPLNFGFDDMDPVVAEGFKAQVERARAAGLEVVERSLSCMEPYGQIPTWHLTSVESRAHYEHWFQNDRDRFDPRVSARMGRADEISAVEYRQTLNRRTDFIDLFRDELGDDLLFLPTTPMLPPKVSELEDDAEFGRLNLLALRNPSLANVADGCGLALPYRHEGTTLSAMLIGANGQDDALLATGKTLEALFGPND